MWRGTRSKCPDFFISDFHLLMKRENNNKSREKKNSYNRNRFSLKDKSMECFFQKHIYWNHFFVLCRHTPWTIRKSWIRALSFRTVLSGNLHAGALPSGPTCIYPRTEKQFQNRKNFFLFPFISFPKNFLSKGILTAKAERIPFFLISFFPHD